METLKQRVAEAAAEALGIALEEARSALEPPRDPRMGDLALPCFALAKRLGRNPAEIAAAAAARMRCAPPLASVRAAGPYLNFAFVPGAVADAVIGRVLAEGQAFGTSRAGAGQTVVIDFSSPNIAKPFGIHHLRSTVIGAAIGRILRARGHDVVGINHLGDWGTQFGQLIVAFRRWGDEERLAAGKIPYLLELYVRFNAEKKEQPALQDEARAAFRALELGDPQARALWRRFREVSEAEFRRIYDLLGVRFEHFTGESFYEEHMPAVVAELERQGLLVESEDATIVDLGADGLGVSIIKKADDSTLYMTRDLAAAIYRFETFRFSRALYVVGAAQTLHFKQMFRVLELLGRPFAKHMAHVPFGLLRFRDAKMSTREGRVIYLEEVLERAVELARSKIREKNPGLEDADRVARAVGIGAVVFNDLKNRRIKDVTFDWDEILAFEGDTGPYLQYAHARIASVFRKAARQPAALLGPFRFALLDSQVERDLTRAVSLYPEAVARAAAEHEPSIISQHLLDLAAVLNRFYIECRILGVDPDLSEARLALVRAAQITLRNGLALLGLEAPDEM